MYPAGGGSDSAPGQPFGGGPACQRAGRPGMALLYRFTRLNDRSNTGVFTFIATRSVTRDLHRDATTKDFPFGYHRWAVSFVRTDKVCLSRAALSQRRPRRDSRCMLRSDTSSVGGNALPATPLPVTPFFSFRVLTYALLFRTVTENILALLANSFS